MDYLKDGLILRAEKKSEQDMWLRHVEHFRKDSLAISWLCNLQKEGIVHCLFSVMFFGKEKHFLWLCIIQKKHSDLIQKKKKKKALPLECLHTFFSLNIMDNFHKCLTVTVWPLRIKIGIF